MKKNPKILIPGLFAAVVGIAFFQNCGGGYAPMAFSSSSLSSISDGPTGNLSIQISWTQPSTGAPTEYLIFQSADNVNFTQVQQVTGSLTSATVSGLGAAKYYFKVSSRNSTADSASQSIVVNLVGN
jgi:hypothetical protein